MEQNLMGGGDNIWGGVVWWGWGGAHESQPPPHGSKGEGGEGSAPPFPLCPIDFGVCPIDLGVQEKPLGGGGYGGGGGEGGGGGGGAVIHTLESSIRKARSRRVFAKKNPRKGPKKRARKKTRKQ